MNKAEEFLNTLVITNKTYAFFTDWKKARSYEDIYRDELALLGVLTNSQDPEAELKRLILSYPRINSLIPLLSAIRVKSTKKLLFVLDKDEKEDLEYNFSTVGVSDEIATRSVEFAVKSGLLSELCKIKNHADYYFGVEVGLDTNGRKNRSGFAMEALVEPYISDLASKYGGRYLTQTNFENAAQIFNVTMPANQFNKRGDFMLFINGKPYNIETNFFDGGGSKQEVINSYISRMQDLNEAGWGFGVVTDGPGWHKNRNQVEHAYATIRHIYNLSMCEQSKLGEMLG